MSFALQIYVCFVSVCVCVCVIHIHCTYKCTCDQHSCITTEVGNVAVPVMQWIAHWTSNSKVVGSSPTRDGFLLVCA